MADTLASGASEGNLVGVQLPPSAPVNPLSLNNFNPSGTNRQARQRLPQEGVEERSQAGILWMPSELRLEPRSESFESVSQLPTPIKKIYPRETNLSL